MKALLIEEGAYDCWETMGDDPSDLIPQAERLWNHYTSAEKKKVRVSVCLVEDDYGTEYDGGYIKSDIWRVVWENGVYLGERA